MADVAFICSGQGSQRLGMGADFLQNSARAREIFAAASDAAGFSVEDVCINGPEDRLNDTAYTQPALVSISLAADAVLEEAGVTPVAVAGFSLGEYAAHAIAGTLDPYEALRLVGIRGRLMAQAAKERPGGMLALLRCSLDQAQELCAVCSEGQVLEPANINCPGQVVISGEESAIQRAEKAWQEQKGRAVRIATSGAFHCSLMREAAESLAQELEKSNFSNPRIPLYCNADANPLIPGREVQMLKTQMTSPVRWEQTVRNMIANGVDTFVELGPGEVLCGLVKRIDRSVARISAGSWQEAQNAIEALAG